MHALLRRAVLIAGLALLARGFEPPAAAAAGLNPIDDEAEFFSLFRYDVFPALAPVKAAVDAQNWPQAKAALLAYMRARTSPAYLFDAIRQRDALVAARAVTQAEIDAATADLSHTFTFEGQTLFVGANIDWTTGGGSGFTTVLNRLGWLPQMCWVYLHTQDEAFAREAIEAVLVDWEQDHPMPAALDFEDPGWHPLNVGFRVFNLPECYFLLLGSPSMTPDDHYVILRSLIEQAMYLYKAIESFDPTNWGNAQSTALVPLGVLFPEVVGSTAWRNRAYDFVSRLLRESTNDEGWSAEYALGYHINQIRGYYRAHELARRNGLALDPYELRKLRNMYDVLLRYRDPAGFSFSSGDTSLYAAYAQFALGQGAAAYLNPEWRAGSIRPQVAEVGLEGLAVYDAMASRARPITSFHDALSKFAVMRSDTVAGFAGGAYPQMIYFDLNQNFLQHQHADVGQIVYYAFNQYVFADPGVYFYGSPQYAELKAAKSHNVLNPHNVWVDVVGAGDLSPRDIMEFESTYGFDYAKGFFQIGNTPPVDPADPDAQRQILYIRPDYIAVVDRVNSLGPTPPHRQNWMFPINSTLSLDPVTKVMTTTFPATFFTDAQISTLPLHPEEVTSAGFEDAFQQGWLGLLYPSQRGWYDFTGAPAVRETLLVAQHPTSENPSASLTPVTPVGLAREQASGFDVHLTQNGAMTRDVLLMNHTPAPAQTTWVTAAQETYVTDAKMAFVRTLPDGSTGRVMIRHGSQITAGGTAILSSTQPLDDLTYFTAFGGAAVLIGTAPTSASVTIFAPAAIVVLYNGIVHSFARNGSFITVDLHHPATRLTIETADPLTVYGGGVNRLTVKAVDADGFVTDQDYTVELASSSAGTIFSPDNFVTMGNTINLTRGTADFSFCDDGSSPSTDLTVSATATSLTTGVKSSITVIKLGPNPPSCSSQPRTRTVLTFPATADTYVNQASPNSNRGRAGTLQVRGNASNKAKIAYLTFNVSGGQGTAVRAKLRLHAKAMDATVSIQAVPDSSWIESGAGGMTWSNRPLPTTLLDQVVVARKELAEFDVSDHVTGNGTFSLALSTTANKAGRSFDSRSRAQPPVLEVTFEQ